jgi:recombinational DNA repair ATPase RecF
MYLNKINGIIPFTDKQISITLNGNDLIITGKNGSGKTQLLETIFSVLNNAEHYKSHYQRYIKIQETQKTALENNLVSIKTNFERTKSQALKRIAQLSALVEQQKSQLVSHPSQKSQCLQQIEHSETQIEQQKESIRPEQLKIQEQQQHTQFNNQ